MATIKAYTTIEQSRKLATILPLESADMYYECTKEEPEYKVHVGRSIAIAYNLFSCRNGHTIPCWSLASLIVILPQFIEFKGDKYYLRFMNDYVEYAHDEISITGRYLHTTGNDNLVDACVDMIEKLDELNLL
jgi:hypothetical protein